jgi:hypothetical protein
VHLINDWDDSSALQLGFLIVHHVWIRALAQFPDLSLMPEITRLKAGNNRLFSDLRRSFSTGLVSVEDRIVDSGVDDENSRDGGSGLHRIGLGSDPA